MSYNDSIQANTGQSATYEEKMAITRNQANAPMQCECGSSHFYQVQLEEYANRGYGSAQFQALSMQPAIAYVCVCGLPVSMSDGSTGKASEGGRAVTVIALVGREDCATELQNSYARYSSG